MAKVTKPDITRHKLTVAQLNAVDLLVTGKTDQEAAEAVGVTRQTVNLAIDALQAPVLGHFTIWTKGGYNCL
jgi:DNA-binding NarL/FixJ family response regulator